MPEDDRAVATRLALYCARNPVALERPTYDRTAKSVTYRSDKSDGPTAGPRPRRPWLTRPAPRPKRPPRHTGAVVRAPCPKK